MNGTGCGTGCSTGCGIGCGTGCGTGCTKTVEGTTAFCDTGITTLSVFS